MNSAGHKWDMTPTGFPHSEIFGSTPACDSPKLFAANHVLHRLLTPRHSPRALSSLTTNFLWASERALVPLRSCPRIIGKPSPPNFATHRLQKSRSKSS